MSYDWIGFSFSKGELDTRGIAMVFSAGLHKAGEIRRDNGG